MTGTQNWERYKDLLYTNDKLGLMLDISQVNFDDHYLSDMAMQMSVAFAEMRDLESGAIANPDEDRMVGHYWLRNSELAPGIAADKSSSQLIGDAIDQALMQIRDFAAKVHSAQVKPETAGRFTHVLVIGIGGSALGPQLAADALGDPKSDKMAVHFFDNTDPDGMQRTLDSIGDELNQTLCVVISKSGGTPETFNGMLTAQAAYKAASLDFGKHAVAVTGINSKLDKAAIADNWIERFPMWDWVGGRTSETCTVGLLPAALQGLNIQQLLAGAAACDEATRNIVVRENPAALLALMWHKATNGKGEKDMVILPYKDRLLLMSRYLQQLIMESLGKELDLDGATVEQGIAVYGNKGSTDQHAYVQQLRDGVNNFFVTFIEVTQDGGNSVEVGQGVTAGDYLFGFLQGTRKALAEKGRESITITLKQVDAWSVGVLIALYERAVGLYASLVNINAYHQPGVQAGKNAANEILDLQSKIDATLAAASSPLTAEAVAEQAGTDDVYIVFKKLEHLAANGRVTKQPGDSPFNATYTA